MDPLTPKKPRSLPPVQDSDATAISSWTVEHTEHDDSDGPDTADMQIGERPTQQTSAVHLSDYEAVAGMRLGEYELAEKIGQGGMGEVWLAVHPLIGKRAAIKILKQELSADPGALERFVDEARVVNQIGHPNIVDVFAFGEMPDGRSYFVMELLKGESLRARIARSPMGLDEVRAIIKPLARALQAAHDKGVIHRDLKPDNVFLVGGGEDLPTAKLLDFGIAKLAKNDHRVEKTATGAIVGTPQYIAPEQAKGYAIDPRADIYALGAILFELLTGRPPFVADNAMEMVAKHLMEAPVRPSSISSGIAPELDELVLRMLAKSPESRPTLAELVATLERSRSTGATRPFDRATPPRPFDGPTTPSGPYAAPTLPTPSAVDIPPTRPRWVLPVMLGVPVIGLVAFLVVRSLGGDSERPPAPVAAQVREATVPPEVAPKPTVEPTPAPPAAPATGTLRIEVNHPRAVITVDDLAYTPDMPLAYGLHRVVVRAKGMQTKELELTVDAPAATRKIMLAPQRREPKRLDPVFTIPDGDGLAKPTK